MPERPIKDIHRQRPRSSAARSSDETEGLISEHPLIDNHGAPSLSMHTIPQLQQAVGNQAVSRLLASTTLVQRGKKRKPANKKKDEKNAAKVFNSKPYASWNAFYDDCSTYLKTGGSERVVWLNRAEAMRLTPPGTATGPHGSQPKGGGFDAHVLGAVDIYNGMVATEWAKRKDDHDLLKEEAAQIARRRAGL